QFLLLRAIEQLLANGRTGTEGRLLGTHERLGERSVEGPGADAAEHPCVQRQHASGLRLAGVEGGLDRELGDLLGVEARRESVADAPDRLLELAPLALDLVDLRGKARARAEDAGLAA